MLVRGRRSRACVLCQIGDSAATGGSVSATISSSVGVGGKNLPPDVLTIQQLLNSISPEEGGPSPPLDEDGWIGPKTNAAIRNFQLHQKTASDGRVDPNGPTLARLKQLAGSRPPGGVNAKVGAADGAATSQRRAERMARLQAAMPDINRVAKAGEAAARSALSFVDDTSTFGFGERGYRLADLHFAFGQQPKPQTRSDLGFITTTFVRIGNVLLTRNSPITGGNPFGTSIFEIDPTGDKEFLAFSPKQAFDGQRTEDIHSGKVYLCDGIDELRSYDRYLITLVHELAHFVDDETHQRNIEDYGYDEEAMTIPHSKRMRNAENYAMFAFHAAFGRARLVASCPPLATAIPAEGS